MMAYRLYPAAAGLAMVLLGCAAEKPTKVEPPQDVLAAAPGRLEGAQETHRIGTNAQGVVKAIHVETGSRVKRGDLLIEIDCLREEREWAALAAKASAARARYRMLAEGYRQEEVAEVAAQTRAADAELARAVAQQSRMKRLLEQRMISDAAFENAQRDERAARAAFDRAGAREALMRSGYRRDEIAEAAATVASLQSEALATRAKLSSCRVVSPAAGEVIRTHVTEGELISPFNPQPLISIADTSRVRVRAELDEQDVGKVRLGQKARVLFDTVRPAASGLVEEILPMMGKKAVFPPDASAKQDRDVLEVIVGLPQFEPQLPIGLRVTVQFLHDTNETKEAGRAQ